MRLTHWSAMINITHLNSSEMNVSLQATGIKMFVILSFDVKMISRMPSSSSLFEDD